MKALVVDDDRLMADLVAFILRQEGFQVIKAFDGHAALLCWGVEKPDLLVLDVDLPGLSGFAVCEQIRRQATTPILLLTARHGEDDINRGLVLGADDYMTKPFSPRQLVGRVQAVLRRNGSRIASPVRHVGGLTLNPDRREISFEPGRTIGLTRLEYRLLDHLMANAGSVMTSEVLIDHVWGSGKITQDILRQLVHRLRGKLAQAKRINGVVSPGRESYTQASETDRTKFENSFDIETVVGVGYTLFIHPLSD